MLIPTRYALAVALTTVVLAGCAPTPEVRNYPVSPTRTEPAISLTDVAARCGLEGSDGVQLNSAGTALRIDTKGPRETSGAAMTDVQCVLGELEVPKDIESKMKLTTSTAEPTDASWGGYGFAWNYDRETHFRIAIDQA